MKVRKYVPIAAVVLGTTVVPVAGGGADRMTGTLNLQAQIRFVSNPGPCPPATPADVICHGRTTVTPSVVQGVGRVSAAYTFMATFTGCPDATARVLAYPARLSIERKGDLDLAVAEYQGCLAQANVPGASPQTFTVTGGTGVFAGASGSGTVTRVAGPPGVNVPGTDTWTGTVLVPGEIKLDLTAPQISGATTKAVRAPRKAKFVRVRFRVTATDDVDGPVPVACPSEFGQPIPHRAYRRQLFGHGHGREHRHGTLHGNGQAHSLRRPAAKWAGSARRKLANIRS